MHRESAHGRTPGSHTRRNRAVRLFFSAALIVGMASLPAFAGSSDGGPAQKFDSYQVDFECGPVGITIHGHASTEIVSIKESNLSPGVRVHYVEQGGILHVTASGVSTSTGGGQSAANGQLIVSMPRYEFVHINTSSGRVYINNLSTNHLSVKTQTGAIDIINTNAAIRVGSTTGDQNYQQIYGAINATSTAGNLSINHTWGIMKLNSQSGSVNAKNVNLAGSSSFHTDTGSINVGLTYGVSQYRYLFNLHSKRGKIRLGDIVRTGNLRWGEGNIRITASTVTGSQDFQ